MSFFVYTSPCILGLHDFLPRQKLAAQNVVGRYELDVRNIIIRFCRRYLFYGLGLFFREQKAKT